MKKLFTYLLVLFCGIGYAQDRLTLQDAIARTLKHNYDINIASLSEQQAARNNTLGNAGFAPYVFLNGTLAGSRNNVQSQLTNGNEQNNPNARNNSYNPAVVVTWTIFDGGRMFIMKKELNELEAMSKVLLQNQMQGAVSHTIQVYAQVVFRQRQLVAVDTALALARVRMFISGMKYETGAGAKVDYLQARVDYNARQSDSLTAVANLTIATDSLSVLMGENEDRQYIVDDSLDLAMDLQPVDKSRLEHDNLSLSVFRYNAKVSHLNADMAKTAFLPSVTFNGGLNYQHNTSSTGFATFSQSYGVNGTLGFSLPLFEGGNLRRVSRVASLQAMKDDLLLEKQNTVIGRAYRTAWRNYEVAVAAYDLEHENIKYAKENLFIQQARFRVGVATTLESREAENDYVAALQRLYSAAYNLKVAETVLLELDNRLVK